MRDKNGRECRVGDLLKVFHFTGARRKKHYMYKLIMIIPNRGKGLLAVDCEELAEIGVEKAHCCDLRALGSFEILNEHYE